MHGCRAVIGMAGVLRYKISSGRLICKRFGFALTSRETVFIYDFDVISVKLPVEGGSLAMDQSMGQRHKTECSTALMSCIWNFMEFCLVCGIISIGNF